MEGKIEYQFSPKLWQHNSEGGWHFVTIPQNYSKEIRSHFQSQEEGWGRMKVAAIINDMDWNTSIWFDTKAQSYILPIKAMIRKKLSLKEDDVLTVSILV